MPLIELRNVHKSYPFGETRVPALAQVNLAIDKGEFVAVWGPSGSGKSTLCNLVGVLDTPTAGTVWLDGREVSTLPDDELCSLRNQQIGFVFQGFNLMPVLSALENVTLPLEIAGEPRSGAKAKAAERLQEPGLGQHYLLFQYLEPEIFDVLDVSFRFIHNFDNNNNSNTFIGVANYELLDWVELFSVITVNMGVGNSEFASLVTYQAFSGVNFSFWTRPGGGKDLA